MRILYNDVWIRPSVAIEVWFNPVKTLLQHHLYFSGYTATKDDDLDTLSWIMAEIFERRRILRTLGGE